jgi:pimeloyl-ACP methyl ester carboxylesterase
MPFATNNGVRLHWQERGEGTPVMLVMGHRYSSAMWYPVLDALAARHRVIWFDNRGTGDSGMTRAVSIGDLVDDTLAVMDAAGVRKAHVFGVSMGGGVVLDLALRHAERTASVILGCTCILTPDKPRTPAWVRALYFLPPWILKRLFANKRPDKGYGSAASPEAIAKDEAVLARDRFSVPGVYAQATAIANYSLSLATAATVTVPALVMHGDEDGTVPYAWGVELAATLPNSEFVQLKGAGHNYLAAAPDKSLAAILDFLRRMDARAATAS